MKIICKTKNIKLYNKTKNQLSLLKEIPFKLEREIQNLFETQLSELVDEKQKKDKVKNFLQAMRKDYLIRLKDRNCVLV